MPICRYELIDSMKVESGGIRALEVQGLIFNKSHMKPHNYHIQHRITFCSIASTPLNIFLRHPCFESFSDNISSYHIAGNFRWWKIS